MGVCELLAVESLEDDLSEDDMQFGKPFDEQENKGENNEERNNPI